jgi:type I restriction enzyme, S subunit
MFVIYDILFESEVYFKPGQDLPMRFSERLEQIKQLGRMNFSLAKTRDLLLGRLIPGKLWVDQLDIQFPPSMRESA